jgi:hypothetical protein
VIGLRKGLRLCRMRRSLSEEEQFRVAEEIAAQLKLSNYEIEQGPPGEGARPAGQPHHELHLSKRNKRRGLWFEMMVQWNMAPLRELSMDHRST